jgi:hypothetical protein
MDLRKTLILLVIFVGTSVTPGFGQVFWSNYSPSGVTDDIWCVTYANGTFAAVTDQGNLLTSADGLTWSSQTIAAGTWLVSIAYGGKSVNFPNGVWVVVGDKGTILVSADLKTWASVTGVTPNKLNGVLFADGLFVAVGEDATIITSPNGLSWTVQTAPVAVTGFLHGITYVASGLSTQDGAAFFISGADGVILMSDIPTAGTQEYVVTLTNLSGSAAGAPFEATLAESNFTWGTYTGPLAVLAGNGAIRSFLTNNNSPLPYVFTDEIGSGLPIPNVDYRGLTNGNGYWVAAGEQGTILSSPDGVTWTQRFAGNSPATVSTSTLLSAAYSSVLQRFVITGTGGTILVSNSTPTVFANVSTRGYVNSSVNGALLDGGFVIEGNSARTILIRADGPVLATFGVSGSLPDPVLTVYNSNGTAIATNTGWTTNANPTTISTAALETGAFALPNPSKDSALLLMLQPGSYLEVTLE